MLAAPLCFLLAGAPNYLNGFNSKIIDISDEKNI